jgi:hypothetical protein
VKIADYATVGHALYKHEYRDISWDHSSNPLALQRWVATYSLSGKLGGVT